MKYDVNSLTIYIKAQSTKQYADSFLNTTFDAKKISSCPACGSSDNMTFSPSKNIILCHGCNVGGNIIDSTMKLKKIEFIPALKDIALNLNLETTLDDDNTTAETVEEAQERQKLFNEQQKQRDKKRAEEERELKSAQDKASLEMAKKAPIYSQELLDNNFAYHHKVNALYPRYDYLSEDFKAQYLGYDRKHDTPVIINRDTQNNVFNFKHRQKFAWDKENNVHLEKRTTGKWISYFNSTTKVFPYDNYLNMLNDSNKVFICEGEKDCINLISYGINAITLGGVANCWDEYSHILKDKEIYIWFDNDNAGYINAIKRYKELREVSKEVNVVLFYHINNALEKKYDISDFIKDKKFANKEDIYHSIAYSSYELTTSLIEDIGEFISKDLEEFYFNEPIKVFRDIKKHWKSYKDDEPKYIITVKGEHDIEGLDDFHSDFKKIKNKNNFIQTKQIMIQEVLPKFADEQNEEVEKYLSMMDEMFANYKKLHKAYSGQHLSDMVVGLERMAYKSSHTFAKFKGQLCVWLGTHYHILDDEKDDFGRFILKDYMRIAKVDNRKKSSNNVKQILDDLYLGADSLDEIKDTQKEKRVINFTNGTMFISKRGKISFKDSHSKKDGATNILGFDYDANAKAPKWEKFINRVIPDENNRKVLMEYIGYCLLPTHAYEAFLFLYGKSGANGKSVIQDVIRNFFGKENISNLQLQNFEGHELHAISNKILNIGSEIDPKGLNKGQMPNLKVLVSPKDSLTINPKNLPPYSLEPENKPKLIFSGNGKPKAGLDDAVFRRMLLISFDEEIKDDEKIRDLSDRFDDELAGILNMALDALQRLIKNGKFSKSQTMKDELDSYKDDVNPLRKYISENISTDNNSMVNKKHLYMHYKTYATEKGNHALNEANFWNGIKDHFKEDVDSKQFTIRGVRAYFAMNLFIDDDEVNGFSFDGSDIETKNINIDKQFKLPLLKEKKA